MPSERQEHEEIIPEEKAVDPPSNAIYETSVLGGKCCLTGNIFASFVPSQAAFASTPATARHGSVQDSCHLEFWWSIMESFRQITSHTFEQGDCQFFCASMIKIPDQESTSHPDSSITKDSSLESMIRHLRIDMQRPTPSVSTTPALKFTLASTSAGSVHCRA